MKLFLYNPKEFIYRYQQIMRDYTFYIIKHLSQRYDSRIKKTLSLELYY